MSERTSKGQGLTLIAGVLAAFLAGFVVGTQVELSRHATPYADLIGIWRNAEIGIVFRPDGTGSTTGRVTEEFLYRVEDDELLLGEVDEGDRVEFSVEGDTLTIDLGRGPMKLRRVPW